jgi:hypothetical protein
MNSKDSIYFNEYVDSNIPYKFQDYTSESRQAKNFLNIGDVNNNYRYARYDGRDRYQSLFSRPTIDTISREITIRLKGVHPEGKNIIVPNETILSVMEAVHTKTNNAELDVMIEMVINYIVNQIRVEYETTQKNNKLSIWTTNYTLDTGMQRFDGIKLNNKTRLNYTRWTY